MDYFKHRYFTCAWCQSQSLIEHAKSPPVIGIVPNVGKDGPDGTAEMTWNCGFCKRINAVQVGRKITKVEEI